jgi:hypothetical protein
LVAVLENQRLSRHVGHIEFEKLHEAERWLWLEGEIGERLPYAHAIQFLTGTAQSLGSAALLGQSFLERSHHSGELGFKRVLNVSTFDSTELPKRRLVDVISSESFRVSHPISKLRFVPFVREIGDVRDHGGLKKVGNRSKPSKHIF